VSVRANPVRSCSFSVAALFEARPARWRGEASANGWRLVVAGVPDGQGHELKSGRVCLQPFFLS